MPDKRLIDANALYATICKYSELKDRSWPTWIENLINAAPTIDAVKVVRCRECTGRKKNKFCIEWMKYVPDDGFCHLGAKMDENKKED